ncbi:MULTISPECIES: glycosyltransferase [Rahnella]|uniref:Glycosyltransferase n=1 Tax=Rahnella laticis TaxID=2787622 RepID=A0ABS0E289_9GAMM|nr:MULTISPECIES: glycosyltransferase [Rahnella]MBF7979209.1 glycosyltransferase [Rahnella laticis]MBF7999526.1 glycosyltransferase [Rahnella sp. LAC-M12]
MAFIQQNQQAVIEVSVIIPVFNAADTLSSLITNILSETRIAIELIIVNDGSTDGTGSIIQGMRDGRIILIEQENQGVYAARNAALAIHRGEWVIFLDADDDAEEGFIFARWQTAIKTQADVVIFNAWRTGAGTSRAAVHTKQPYGHSLSGHEWIRHCVTQREWPHYLWLQIVRSSYAKGNALHFQTGKSHKDILWTLDLAVANGRFYLSDLKDYTYRINAASITHRHDYYDVRAQSYIDVVAEIIRLAELKSNKAVSLFLYRHALREARHFLGLYRNHVHNRPALKADFSRRISKVSLARGISSISDVFFLVKLWVKLS